jgi:pre-mRNA-splicing factor CWC22
LNVFKIDPNFEQSEVEWAAIRVELLGESSEGEESADASGGEDDSESESDEEAAPETQEVLPSASTSRLTAACPCNCKRR